ncbi:MAG: hypothetical protein H0W75_11620 [Chitinophagaceae bacterium]|nr:hypothetical protein [Chitinophagaceae bacterium]
MKYFYTVYTKPLQGTNHYFVKKFITFPEYTNVPDVLESFGMHTDFNEACRIAKVIDEDIKQQLLKNLENNVTDAKVIPMNVGKASLQNKPNRLINFLM